MPFARKKKSPDREHTLPVEKPEKRISPKRGESRKKLKIKHQSERIVLVKRKFGNDTTKTNLGTNISGAEFDSETISGVRTEFKHTVDPCPAGEYVIEGYFEVDESVSEPVGRLKHNKSIKHQSKARKNGDNVFSFIEEITVVDVIIQETVLDENGDEITVDKVLGPHDFTIDFEEIAGKKVKILRGTLDVYRVDKYEPPERVTTPTPGIPDNIPMNQGVK